MTKKKHADKLVDYYAFIEILSEKLVETQEMPMQFNMFDGPKNEIIEELKNISLEVLTPIEAMNKLFELKNKAEKLN